MGLAAGQARLLTITGRKSDCEFESMRLSHQKIALARELAYISNEYQNSLDQTKLVYDYYGTGDTSTPLSYGLLMTPSALNDYMPTLLTDSAGRIMLNGKLALAAKAAGIPQEGLGTLPSETMRNNFIAGLIDNGVLNAYTGEKIMSLPYNQTAGVGGGATVATVTQDVSYDELKDMLNDYHGSPLETIFNDDYTRCINIYDNKNNTFLFKNASWGDGGDFNDIRSRNYTQNSDLSSISLKDILEGDYVLIAAGQDERNSALGFAGGAIDAVVNSEVWNDMMSACEELLDIGDTYTQKALEYARSQIEYMISNQCDQSKGPGAFGDDKESKSTKWQYHNDEDMKNFAFHEGGSYEENDWTVMTNAANWASDDGDNYIGLVCRFNCGEGRDDDSDISAISVNISNVFKAYLTYFADFMNGLSKTDAYGREIYDVTNQRSTSKLVGDEFTFKVKTGTNISSDDLGQATFYDAMFNQICLHGWAENDHVTDNDYLKDMLQNGMMFISKVKNDGFYYQGNYATDNYIKEVADETLIAQAEAKYNTEKAKLNAKEETLDLKMKNLDTEISSLTTEYDTVKNTISKNIEKSFKRYNA